MSILNSLKSMFTPAPRVDAATASARVKSGEAVLVDVREPAEWAGGVAERAALLPMSDLTGSRKQWKGFLAGAKGREVLLYCASGARSGSAAKLLQSEGLHASNVGGLGDLAAAGWRIVKPSQR